jgi:ribosome-binding protein aMBF1 (putative translation factor)
MASNLKMNKALSERIEEAILESGMSQAKISRAMSVDPSCITRWKKQVYRPRKKQLQEFGNIVGVTLEWLLTGEEKETWFLYPANKKQKI